MIEVDSSAVHEAQRVRAVPNRNLSLIGDIGIFVLVVLACDFGVFTEADGVLCAAAIAVMRPSILPYLILLIAGFQDAKGLSGLWWYGGTLGLGAWLVLKCRLKGVDSLQKSAVTFRVLLALAVVTILYGIASSYIQDSLSVNPQATEREPYIVGALALAMALIGIACSFSMRTDRQAAAKILAVCCLVLVNGLLISIARVLYGYDQFLSAAGISQMDEASLVEDTPLGFPRLTGSYLTPIGFAMYILLMIVLWEIHTRQKKISGWFIGFYGLVAVVLSAMSLSKGIAIFFLVTSVVLLVSRPRYIVAATICIASAIAWVISVVGLDALSLAFRIEQGTSNLSYRAIAWSETLEHFTWHDWLFGTGIAYWPNFLQRYAGFALSDPHNYLLSIPGTYGVLGVVLYVVLAGCLLVVWRGLRGYERIAALSLATVFFVVNAVSIPYVIGNTPITACIWTALAALCGFIPSERHDAGGQ